MAPASQIQLSMDVQHFVVIRTKPCQDALDVNTSGQSFVSAMPAHATDQKWHQAGLTRGNAPYPGQGPPQAEHVAGARLQLPRQVVLWVTPFHNQQGRLSLYNMS
jgi:hypothetical protein